MFMWHDAPLNMMLRWAQRLMGDTYDICQEWLIQDTTAVEPCLPINGPVNVWLIIMNSKIGNTCASSNACSKMSGKPLSLCRINQHVGNI